MIFPVISGQLIKPHDGSSELYCRKERSGGFSVSCSDSAPLLKMQEGVRGGPGLLDRISAKLSYRLIDVMPHSFCYQGHGPDKFLHYCKPHPVFVH